MGVIYLLTFPDGMKYVGQTVNFDDRMRNHGSGHGHCRKVQEWTHKYGWGNVVKQQLFECVDMNNAEINTITEYGTIWPNGLNLVRGGEAPDGKYGKDVYSIHVEPQCLCRRPFTHAHRAKQWATHGMSDPLSVFVPYSSRSIWFSWP